MIRVILVLHTGQSPRCSRPEKAKSLSTPKRVQHMISFAFFEVGFIRRIVWVSFASDFYVSFNGGADCASSNRTLRGCPSSSHVSPKKNQLRPRCRSKYFCLSQREDLYSGVFSGPIATDSRRLRDLRDENTRLLDHVPMIVCPTSYFGVEFINQIGGRHAKRGFDRCFGYHPGRS